MTSLRLRRCGLIATAVLALGMLGGTGAASAAAAYNIETTFTVSGPLVVGIVVNLELRATNTGTEAYPYNVTGQMWLTDAVKRTNVPLDILCEAYRGTHGGSTVYRDYCRTTLIGPIAPGASVAMVLPIKVITAGDTNTIGETTSGEPWSAPGIIGVYYPNLVRINLPLHIDPAPAPVGGGGGGGGGATGGTGGTPDLSAGGKASTGSPAAGSAFSETFSVKNTGKAAATGVTFSAVVPAGVTVSGAQGGTCAVTGGLVSCALADLGAGSSASVQVNLVAPTTLGAYATTGSFASTNGDSNPANNAATVSVTVK